jgi:transposase
VVACLRLVIDGKVITEVRTFQTTTADVASLADRRVNASPGEFREALRGRVTKHHRFLLRLHLNQIDALDTAMATLDAQVVANLGPFRTAVDLVMSIPGMRVNRSRWVSAGF